MAKDKLDWDYETFMNSTPAFFFGQLDEREKYFGEATQAKPKEVVVEYRDDLPAGSIL